MANKAKTSLIWKIPADTFAGFVKDSYSVSGILRRLGTAKSSFKTVVSRIEQDKLDISHFKRGGFNKGVEIPLEEILVEHSTYSRYHLKKRLLRDGILENKCAICELDPIWQDKLLVLILDHKNGIRDDARLENLRFICPNCNSQTDTFAGRNR